jgi:excisionase family DNA binding protein
VTVVDLEDLRASRSAVITIADAAAVLGVDARTVSRAVQSGELPALRVGRRLLIPRLPLLARLGVIDSGSGAQQDSPTVA